jgi:hypothetical protein
MKNTIKLATVSALMLTNIFSTVAFAEGGNSGFLADYSALSETKDSTGDKVMRYVNPKFTSSGYQAVIIDPVQYYPAPKPSDQVTTGTLTEISNYVNKGLSEKLGSKITLATEPALGVARMRTAITAVAANSAGLKPRDLVPIGFIISSVKGRDKEAAIQIEVEIVDSVTGELLGASVRKGVGAKLAGKDASLSLKDVQPLLDKWINTGSSFVAERLK